MVIFSFPIDQKYIKFLIAYFLHLEKKSKAFLWTLYTISLGLQLFHYFFYYFAHTWSKLCLLANLSIAGFDLHDYV